MKSLSHLINVKSKTYLSFFLSFFLWFVFLEIFFNCVRKNSSSNKNFGYHGHCFLATVSKVVAHCWSLLSFQAKKLVNAFNSCKDRNFLFHFLFVLLLLPTAVFQPAILNSLNP